MSEDRNEETLPKQKAEETSSEKIVAAGSPEEVKRESARRTRRSFLVSGVTAAAAYGVSQWIADAPKVDELQPGLRKVLNFNAAVNRAVWRERGLSRTYSIADAVPLRLNGVVGIEQTLLPSSYRLQLAGTRDPQASPRFSKDVTAWNYEYGGDMQADMQADDVKSAPGNGTTSKTGAPVPQQIALGGSKDTNQPPEKNPPDNNPPDNKIDPAKLKSQKPNTLNPDGAVDSKAGASLADHIAAMVAAQQPKSKKRNIGSDEAGPSSSSLDIGTPGLLLTMDDLRQLPRVEFVTEFKCIEGWSSITQWAGVRLRDLLDLYPPAQINGRDPRYIYMETPDGNYYGGYDLAAARHPQSLLVMEMGGQPLTQEHGAPLRLHMPIKYGYKQLKRIGLIAYMDTKPDDYWTKLGYDWYAGL
jgi:hypothetical protein